ncbi:hypothetical protein [Cellulomonas terrae]|uniref:Uncharacterized protein n=1 Tax=Cellulomonas terrae TaxID=311234 RepID=A0A511JLS8_9CELL|nr:hypothetical protein [Cellulomonas terrae]GEL98884.1 hypothetical protein CTE05_24310 [Cellulomonas terrae]
MLRRLALAVVAATALSLVAVAPAMADDPPGFEGNVPGLPSPSTPEVTPGAGAGSVQVTVSQTGTTAGGTTFSPPTTVRTVAPICWYSRGQTGYDYYEYWKPGGPARNAGTLDAYAAQGLLHPNYEAYATDTTGYWYEPRCQYDAPTETYLAYRGTHPPVFVPAGEPAPAQDATVDPEVLAQIASESMDLPEGTIRWNPSLVGSGATVVNTDTWVWVEGAATSVSVTASIPSGLSATVNAVLSGMELSAPGSDGTTCADTGTPWTAGATSTSCALTFYRSTANQPVKAGQSLPTATLTATATWTASWVSSVDPNPTALPAQTLATTAEVPVAEIQSIVTRG